MCCTLFYENDFVNQNSKLEDVCEIYGIQVPSLPKFHCKLNFIEQCWGYAKRKYRLLEPSSKEAVLEKNVKYVLDEVPLLTMHW
jgi:hypothetical protein